MIRQCSQRVAGHLDASSALANNNNVNFFVYQNIAFPARAVYRRTYLRLITLRNLPADTAIFSNCSAGMVL